MEASEDLLKGGQADAVFLAVLDPDEKKISVIGINRDTMTDISVYDENGLYIGTQTAQIALQHGYGDGMETAASAWWRRSLIFFTAFPSMATVR